MGTYFAVGLDFKRSLHERVWVGRQVAGPVVGTAGSRNERERLVGGKGAGEELGTW